MVLRFEVSFYFKTDCLKGTTQDVGNDENRGKKNKPDILCLKLSLMFFVLLYTKM